MSIPRMFRSGLHYINNDTSLISNKKESAFVAKTALSAQKRAVEEKQKSVTNSVSELAEKKKWIRHGWGVANIRKYSILNKSNASKKWKLLFFTNRTIDQVIAPAAPKEGRNKEQLIADRVAYSRGIPDRQFIKEHISRPKPEFTGALEDYMKKINNPDGSKYQTKFRHQSEYINIYNPNKNDTPLLQRLTSISLALEAKINAVPQGTNKRIGLKKPLATNYMLMLSFAIHSACKDTFNTTIKNGGKPVPEATIKAALDYLTELPLLESVVVDDANRPAGPHTEHIKLAWRIAYKMAATPTGFDMLKNINTTENERQYTNPAILDGTATEEEKAQAARHNRKNLRRDESIRLFMQGADALLQDENPDNLHDMDPASLLTYCRDAEKKNDNRQNSLLIHALPALQTAVVKNELPNEGEPILKTDWPELVATSPGNLDDQPMWAANALRNGFFSNAVGSPFHKANARLEKVSLQVTRGLKNQGHAETDATRDPELAPVAERSSALPRMFKRNRGKTPFNVNMTINIAANSVLLQREKMVAALRLLDKILYERLPGDLKNSMRHFNGENLESAPDNKWVLENIARIIYVRAWASTTQSEILDGRPLPDGVAKKLLTNEYILSLMGTDHTGPISAAMKNHLRKIKVILGDLNKQPLTTTTLDEFFDQGNLLHDRLALDNEDAPAGTNIKDIPDVKNISDMNLNQCLIAFERARNHLVNGEDDAKVTREDTPSRADIATYLNQQAQRMRLASSIKFSDGVSVGAGIAGLTAVGWRIFLGGIFGGRANFSYRRSRIATTEIGVNASSGFARFGTETNHVTRRGAGGTVGWTFAKFRNMTAGTGAYADGKLIYDPGQFTGVTLRLDRLGQDVTGQEGRHHGVVGDADMTVKLGNTIEQVINGPKATRKGNLLQQVLEAQPQLSVCWVDEGDSTTRDTGHIAQAGLLLGTFVSGVGIGTSASLARTRKYQKQHYEEETGALRSRNIVRAERTTINGQITALGVANLATLSGQSIVSKETLAFTEILNADAEIYRDGTREEIRTIEHQGQLSPRSYKLIIHANAEAFATKVEQDIQEWGQRFVQVKEPKNYFYNEHEDPEKWGKQMTATGEQAGIVRDMIQKVRETADPNTSYLEYLELEEATTIEINRYRHMAKMAGLAGPEGEEEQQILHEAAERLLKDPKSYVRRFLFTTTVRAADEGRLVNFIGSFATTSSATQIVMRDGFAG